MGFMDIIKFIDGFKKGHALEVIEDMFLNSKCFHFATILNNLFGGDIVYDLDLNHFVLKTNNKYYDITGEVEEPFSSYLWEEMEDIDPIEYDLVYDSCVLMK